MTGNSIARSADDIDQSTLDAAEAKALATNNPMLLEKLTVDKEVMNLQLLKSSWQSTRITLNKQVETTIPERLTILGTRIPQLQQDLSVFQTKDTEDFEIQLGGQRYVERKEALEVLNTLFPDKNSGSGQISIGKYRGFDLSVVPATSGQIVAVLTGNVEHKVMLERNGSGSFTRMNNALYAISKELNDAKNEQADLQTSLQEAQEQLNKPFEQEQQLSELLTKQSEINLALEIGEQVPTTYKMQNNNVIQAPKVPLPTTKTVSAAKGASQEQMM